MWRAFPPPHLPPIVLKTYAGLSRKQNFIRSLTLDVLRTHEGEKGFVA